MESSIGVDADAEAVSFFSPGSGTSKRSEFTVLADLLAQAPRAVEIVPGDSASWMVSSSNAHHPFLFLDGNLGVPQKILYRVYLDAVSVFEYARKSKGDEAIANLLSSSSVILLANPGHLTAINTRKRLVQADHLDVRRELLYITSLMTLKEASKQSILWHHRQWLFKLSYGYLSNGILELADQVLLPPDVFQNEFSIISRACEIYPCNYYAWTYRYWCLKALSQSIRQSRYRDPDSFHRYLHLLSEEADMNYNWLELHVSDHSAVHYFCCLTEECFRNAADESDHTTYADGLQPPTWRVASVAHALSLVQSYPDHESLWMYLRRALRSDDGGPGPEKIPDLAEAKFTRWSAGIDLPISLQDHRLVSILANRFLAWMAVTSSHSKTDGDLARGIISDKTTIIPGVAGNVAVLSPIHGA